MSSANSRPMLTLHVGQAGIQIGHAAWELMCLEHNLDKSGAPRPECNGEHGNVDTMFIASPQGSFFPRSIFVDTDPFCVDEVRSGPYRGLFNSRQLLSDELDSGTNYTTGRYRYSTRLLPETIDRLRWLVEKTDVKPMVCLMHSSCGGTGSGFSVSCLSLAEEELGLSGRNTLDWCVVPGRMAIQSSCELLNTALYLDESQNLVRQTICVSNSALFRVCTSQLQSNGRATYAHVNRILATAFSNLTATERLNGSSVSMTNIFDSLLPFQHLKYPMLACAPFLTSETSRIDLPTAKSATAAVLEVGSQFLDVDPRKGRHAAGFLLYRGDTTTAEVHKLAAELTQKKRVEFHDWAPSGFRTGLVGAPPIAPPGSGFADTPISVTMVTSHSGVSTIFEQFASAAHLLQERDLFVHNYEGAIVAMLRQPLLSQVGGGGGTGSNPEETSTEMVIVGGGGENGNSVGLWNSSSMVHKAREDFGPQKLHRQSSRRHLHSSKRMGSTLSLSKKQQQQPQEHGELAKRTCGLSDVFGVRVRLALAIQFLERLVRIYAEGCPPTPTSSHSSAESGGDDEQRDLVSFRHHGRERSVVAKTGRPVKFEAKSSINVVGETDETADGAELQGDGGDVGFNQVVELDSESTMRWDEQQLKTEDEATRSPPSQQQPQEPPTEDNELKTLERQMQQQNSQSQNQPTNMSATEFWSSSESSSSTTAIETRPGVSRLNRVVAHIGALWRKLGGGKSSRQQQQEQQMQHDRRQKKLQQMRQQMHQLVSLSSRAGGYAGSASEQEQYPVIAEAERILMKYRFRDED